ncbi:16S rRNA (cytosine(1402)-N(4))-methyltransferase RsmH [Candidatus Phytoplasma pini]|uniref:Ribosomal RNA small subunit methyltransferase H n=1 Tax=Candidatus Phytoplasma pini TaxID=267362 RepID=A0A559KJQ7_9MOLU|nr:16S rRNA (cytosine(1402)-N(4))-methyltransferase RsmH [Candidatus Phytoplasma pini]TVY12361.1 methyltransferase involved in cell envelope biogenesis [Candidatus Phytoplasma pini]
MLLLKHSPVLTSEVIKYLNIQNKGIYVDATLGGGGHSYAILQHISQGLLLSFDQDFFSIQYCSKRFSQTKNIILIHKNFVFLKEELNKRNIFAINGIVFDLGLSSFQIDDKKRGFSYLHDDVLDMRMNRDEKKTALTILNTYNLEELKKIFFLYGEEPKAALIAREIIKKRPIYTTLELVRIIDKFYNSFYNKKKGHNAKRVFQALRIETNQELRCLKKGLQQSLTLLKKNGRIVVVSFNSLEDRIVKRFFKQNSECNFLPRIPILKSDLPPNYFNILTKKVIRPNDKEIILNPRSRSAKLRAAIKKI